MPIDLLGYQQMSINAKPVLRHHPPLTHNFTLLTLPSQQYSRANTQRKKEERKSYLRSQVHSEAGSLSYFTIESQKENRGKNAHLDVAGKK